MEEEIFPATLTKSYDIYSPIEELRGEYIMWASYDYDYE